MNLVTVARVQRNPTVKAEIQMRNFEASIPVVSSVIQSVRQQILLLSEQRIVPVGADDRADADDRAVVKNRNTNSITV